MPAITDLYPELEHCPVYFGPEGPDRMTVTVTYNPHHITSRWHQKWGRAENVPALCDFAMGWDLTWPADLSEADADAIEEATGKRPSPGDVVPLVVPAVELLPASAVQHILATCVQHSLLGAAMGKVRTSTSA